MFKIKLSNLKIAIEARRELTSGSSSIPVHFEFNDRWRELNKIIVFKCNDMMIDALIDETDTAALPWELLKPENVGKDLEIGICGMLGNMIVYPTQYCYLGRIVQGADPSGDVSIDRSPTIIEQILEISQNAIDAANRAEGIAQSVRDDADAGRLSPTAKVVKSGQRATITITDKVGTTTATITEPTAKVEKIGDTATITLTDSDGQTQATIKDGAKGETGNTYYATFEVNNDVELIMHNDENYTGANFSLNDEGELEVII